MMANAPLFAFGFANLLMLGWLGAAAAPILIHLWNKRRFREVPWAAIDFLLAAMKKNSRRMRLEQWLLLAIRTALVALLVLAVAQPFLEKAGLGFVAGERTLKVLVLDGSYSMGYRPADKSRFDRAKQFAAQIVKDSSQGDAFALVVMGEPPVAVVASPAIEQHDFLDEIENLKLPHAGANLPATLVEVERILSASGSNLPRKEVFFLTDLGRNTWLPDVRDAQTTAYHEHVAKLAREAALVVVDLGQGGSENLAVTRLSAGDAYVTTAGEATFTAQVRNFGAAAQSPSRGVERRRPSRQGSPRRRACRRNGERDIYSSLR